MKTKNIILSLFLGIGLLGGAGCTDGFDDINKDPNKVNENDYDFSLIDVGTVLKLFGNYNYVLANNALAGGGHLEERIKMLTLDPYVQYTIGSYGANDSWQGDYWMGHHTTYMGLLNGVIRDANEYENRENSKSYARIWRVMVMSTFTDYFGPTPFAIDPLDPNPDYMSLDKLYPILFTELDEAPKEFDPGKRLMDGSMDPLMSGDITTWKKLANSLRLRLALKVSEINPELCKAQILAACKDPNGFIGPNENIESPAYENWGNTYPYQVIGWSQMLMSSTMENILTGIGGFKYDGDADIHPEYADPRGTLMFDPSLINEDNPQSYWKGMNPAMADMGNTNKRVAIMSVANFRTDPQKKIKLITHPEICFLLSEAVERGFVSETDAKGSAKSWYEAGVRASFDEWGIADKATAYLNSDAKNTWGTSAKYGDKVSDNGNSNLEKIVTQRYIICYPDMATQVWNDKRRLNLPAMVIPEVRSAGVGTWPHDNNIHNPANYIQRSLYPQSEAHNNANKYKAGVAQLRDGDKVSSPLWWASKGINYCTSSN